MINYLFNNKNNIELVGYKEVVNSGNLSGEVSSIYLINKNKDNNDTNTITNNNSNTIEDKDKLIKILY